MKEEKYTQRLFGTADDGVLYLSGPIMKAAKVRPGDKLRITAEKYGFRVQLDNPRPGGQP